MARKSRRRLYAIVVSGKPSFVAAIGHSRGLSQAKLAKLVALAKKSPVNVDITFLPLKFPFYIVEKRLGRFAFHQDKPKLKRSKSASGLPIIYHVTKAFCWVSKDGDFEDKMGALPHEHHCRLPSPIAKFKFKC